jgi:glycosyltransferase involved in cell wall biosynthesis
MKLSIIIPAYNEENYLGKCLTATLAEIKKTNREVEVIVVNNASTDNTRAVALVFPGVKVIDEERKGLTRARQAGFEASTGDLIANIDADTIIPSGWINKVFKKFEKDQNLVALSGPQAFNDQSRWFNFAVFLFYSLGYIAYVINHTLRIGGMLQGGNYILRRSALEKIGGYDTTIDFYGEDADIAKRIVKEGKVLFTFWLPVYGSSRRLKYEGLLTMGARYGLNYVWMMMFKKPFTKKSIDVRT